MSAVAEKRKPNLIQSIALGGASCVFTVNFTHPIGTSLCCIPCRPIHTVEINNEVKRSFSYFVLTFTFSYLNLFVETVKTRMQVTGSTIGETVGSLVKSEGVSAFWKGIVFAWGREASYASIKLGAYAPVRDALGASGADAPFYLKFLAGALTGGVGSVIGNPFDVMKTLAQANKGKPVPLSTLVGNMYRDQGIGGFYRGVQANVARACVLNATKMACYDISKGCKCCVVFNFFLIVR